MKKLMLLIVVLISFSCSSLNEEPVPQIEMESVLVQKKKLDNDLKELSSLMRHQGITFESSKDFKNLANVFFEKNEIENKNFEESFERSLSFSQDLGSSKRVMSSPELDILISDINKEIKNFNEYDQILDYLDEKIVRILSSDKFDVSVKEKLLNYLVFQSVFLKFYNENLDLIYNEKSNSRILACGVDQGTALDIGLAIWGGALIGAGSGALGGSVVPVVGTTVGALGGFLVGAISSAVLTTGYTLVSQAIQCSK
jgi:hypothetical protein